MINYPSPDTDIRCQSLVTRSHQESHGSSQGLGSASDCAVCPGESWGLESMESRAREERGILSMGIAIDRNTGFTSQVMYATCCKYHSSLTEWAFYIWKEVPSSSLGMTCDWNWRSYKGLFPCPSTSRQWHGPCRRANLTSPSNGGLLITCCIPWDSLKESLSSTFVEHYLSLFFF